jgi:hypothetical protein
MKKAALALDMAGPPSRRTAGATPFRERRRHRPRPTAIPGAILLTPGRRLDELAAG